MVAHESDVLTMAEVCSRLRVSYATVLKMINQGQIRGAFKVGSGTVSRRLRWRIPTTELQRIVEERTAVPGK